MLRGSINHLDLTVADLDVSSAFYDKVLGRLGYTRTSEYEGNVPCWVLSSSNSAVSIGLHKSRVATPHNRFSVGLHHLAFHLTSRAEVDSIHKFLVQEQITVLDAPAEYDYTPGYYAVFFADPDGIKLELAYEPRLDQTTAHSCQSLGALLRPKMSDSQ
jgi:catechol 2,3-dioxygenase-like lactoylglutathione lyase family enzyme